MSSFRAEGTPTRRVATSSRCSRRPCSSAGADVACGTPTATSTSSTGWACGRSGSAMRIAPVTEAVSSRSTSAPTSPGRRSSSSKCAERFLEVIPTAEMVKFTKDGSTAHERRGQAGPQGHRARLASRSAPTTRSSRTTTGSSPPPRPTAASCRTSSTSWPASRTTISTSLQRAVRGAPGSDRRGVPRAGPDRTAGAGLPRGRAFAVRSLRSGVGVRRDDHRLPLRAPRRCRASTACSRTCRRSARRSPTASRCRRSPAAASSCASAAARPTTTTCSSCRRRTAPRRRRSPQRSRRSTCIAPSR